jgi:hypothetical protein
VRYAARSGDLHLERPSSRLDEPSTDEVSRKSAMTPIVFHGPNNTSFDRVEDPALIGGADEAFTNAARSGAPEVVLTRAS